MSKGVLNSDTLLKYASLCQYYSDTYTVANYIVYSMKDTVSNRQLLYKAQALALTGV